MRNSERIKVKDTNGRFVRGIHYSPDTEFKKGDPPKNFGRGQFKKGHPGYLKHTNKTSFKKGQIAWNKGKKGAWGANKGSFRKGSTPYIKGKRIPQISGENHPNWKGGITKLAEKIRKYERYKQWRSDIFQRDNWTCQFCHKKGGVYLNAHHYSKGFYQILRDNSIKTLEQAFRCEKLWNINNGMTLCRECHKLTKQGRPKKV